MTTNDIYRTISLWNTWATNPNNQRYDIALLKIWIQFERFIADLFIKYATGFTSETGFAPCLNLQFKDEEQLNVFLREGNRTYIEYLTQIQKLSKHIFENNPFEVIFADANNYSAYKQIIAIRNYIAHESGEAKSKMINCCFSGNEAKFKEPNDYLKSKEKSTKTTYYTYYTNIISNISRLLVDPPQ